MILRIRRWGNSIAIRLPKAVAQTVQLREGSQVSVQATGGRILMTPLRRPVYRLSELVRGITRGNRHGSIDTGRPRGREDW